MCIFYVFKIHLIGNLIPTVKIVVKSSATDILVTACVVAYMPSCEIFSMSF